LARGAPRSAAARADRDAGRRGPARAGIVFLVHTEIANRIEYQQERNNYLRGEIARLKKAAEELQELQKTKNRLVDRLNVIQKLQASRPGMVRMLDELVRLIPQDIY
jgi:type IV pilus assembly protein PilN